MFEDLATITSTPSTPNTPAPFAPIPNTERPHAPGTDLRQILYKVVTPYLPEAWRRALLDADLIQNYYNLVHDFEFGSPIGNPPSIEFPFIPENLPSPEIKPAYITNLIAEEVSAGRMDGPFSVEEVHSIYLWWSFPHVPAWLGRETRLR